MTSSINHRNLSGKVAIVTGASRLKGIGAAICLELAKEGADIFFTYWTKYDSFFPWKGLEDEPARLAEQLEKQGIKCYRQELDLTDPLSPIKLLDEVQNQLGNPHILVNNACYSNSDSYETLSHSTLDSHYQMNVRATTLLSLEFIKRFKNTSSGRIINLSSGQSLGPMTDELSYAITKGAVETLTYTLAAAVAHKGITVNAINPGPTDTGWMNAEDKKHLSSRFPMGRLGEPKDAANLISFLASDEAEWITGQIIHSEGGFKR
ncbi:3-oxoacyl-[acyl-carrier protein] reductase [Peribacillus deserti]|uniref:3-oxoacyl-[acyl-carrier protein] reductase n=1 Tax=Peribacillus deserti TaxID=673318 RepID=A0ABS2QF72_9BACI|nr:SDR family oxidoreductase [Peribacillus deserti]MBM7691354.1 3-oxoacyl-[acyl-carrier protein] reductase [Peribacillus deserti]